MNGIDKIISRLESDARAEIDAVNAASREECEAILTEYREKAAAAGENARRQGELACAQRAERLASAADMEAKKALLGFKQELVSQVFDKAAARLCGLKQKDYVAFLAAQAAKASITGTEELVFCAKDAKGVGAEVAKAANALLGDKGKLSVSRETRNIPGGVIVKQGDIETNCAVDMLVQLRRSDLASQVAEILFSA